MTSKRPRRAWFGLAAALITGLFGSALAYAQAPAQPVVIDVPAPELAKGIWLNTVGGKPISLASRRGKVTVVEFWTFGCINCMRNLPIYARWQQQFKKNDVVVIGIHTPETQGERDPANVVRFIKKNKITYPVLLDAQGQNWRRWDQQFWPTVYLLDKHGNVRYRWEGELEWQNAGGEQIMADRIRELLQEK